MAAIYVITNGNVTDEEDVNQLISALNNVLGISDTAQTRVGRLVLPEGIPGSPADDQIWVNNVATGRGKPLEIFRPAVGTTFPAQTLRFGFVADPPAQSDNSLGGLTGITWASISLGVSGLNRNMAGASPSGSRVQHIIFGWVRMEGTKSGSAGVVDVGLRWNNGNTIVPTNVLYRATHHYNASASVVITMPFCDSVPEDGDGIGNTTTWALEAGHTGLTGSPTFTAVVNHAAFSY